MGALFMQRNYSFCMKLGTFCNSGLRRKCLDGRKFLCNIYSGVSAMRVSDESDYSTSNNESGSESEGGVLRERTKEFEGVELFSAVVRVVKSLNWRVARKLCFAKAVERYGFDRSFAAYKMFVNVYASAGLKEEVFALIRDIVSYYQNAGLDMFDIMSLLLEQHGDAKGSSFVVSVLMKVFASNRILDKAIDVFVQSKKKEIELDLRSCNFLLKCLAESNELEALLAVFEDMKNFGRPFPSVYTYTIVIKVYCSGSKGEVWIEEAAVLLEEMKAKGINPSVVTYHTYINGLCRVDVDFAWKYLQGLKKSSQPLNCYSYNSVIHGFVDKGEIDKAIDVFDELNRSGIGPDVYSYSILIEGFCRYGNVERSLSLCKEMQNNGLKPSLVTYTSILKGLFNYGSMEQSLDMVEKIEKSGIEFDQHIYNVLVTGFCTQGDMDMANALLEEMIRNDLSPSSLCYKSLILGFSKIGSPEKALTFFNLMTESCAISSTVFTCNHVVDGYCKKGLIKEALRFINEMRQKGISPNIITYGLVIDRLCKEHKIERALELIPLMLKSDISPNVVIYSCLIDGFSKQGKTEEALNLRGKMLKVGVFPDSITYTILINVFSAGGMLDHARDLFKVMISQGINPDKFCYTSIIAGYCREEEMERAREMYKEMLKKDILPSVVTYTCLISGYFKVGNVNMVGMLCHEMWEKMVSPDDFTYAVLIRGYQRLGLADKAKEMLDEMQRERE